MSFLDAILLGILQGITEFLPVSSSGHLTVAQHLLGYKPAEQILFDVVVHLGTLGVVFWVFRESLIRYVAAVPVVLRSPEVPEPLLTRAWKRVEVREMTWILLATIPTGIIGLTFRKQFEAMFSSVYAVAWAFLITAGMLLVTRLLLAGERAVADLGPWRAIVIGIAQGLAITPGVSRSGTTIAWALFLGMRRDEAGRFSFLLAIPAISGATFLELRKVDWSQTAVWPLVGGFFAAAITGYFALQILLRLVKQGQLAWFSLYLGLLSAWILLFLKV